MKAHFTSDSKKSCTAAPRNFAFFEEIAVFGMRESLFSSLSYTGSTLLCRSHTNVFDSRMPLTNLLPLLLQNEPMLGFSTQSIVQRFIATTSVSSSFSSPSARVEKPTFVPYCTSERSRSPFGVPLIPHSGAEARIQLRPTHVLLLSSLRERILMQESSGLMSG